MSTSFLPYQPIEWQRSQTDSEDPNSPTYDNYADVDAPEKINGQFNYNKEKIGILQARASRENFNSQGQGATSGATGEMATHLFICPIEMDVQYGDRVRYVGTQTWMKITTYYQPEGVSGFKGPLTAGQRSKQLLAQELTND